MKRSTTRICSLFGLLRTGRREVVSLEKSRMASYTLPLAPSATRSWTSQELAVLFFQFNASGQRYPKTESVAVVRLGERGRLALVQVDDWQLGRTLANLYDIDWDPTQGFQLRYHILPHPRMKFQKGGGPKWGRRGV